MTVQIEEEDVICYEYGGYASVYRDIYFFTVDDADGILTISNSAFTNLQFTDSKGFLQYTQVDSIIIEFSRFERIFFLDGILSGGTEGDVFNSISISDS